MPTMTATLNTLREAGFKLPHEQGLFHHPLLSPNGSPVDPREFGFTYAHTGGGCEALEMVLGSFLIMITCEDGCTIPDPEEWQQALIGVYRNDDDRDEVALLTGQEWLQLLAAVEQV